MVGMYAIGVGSKRNYKQLQEWGAYPYYSHAFLIKDYEILTKPKFSNDLAAKVCASKYISSYICYFYPLQERRTKPLNENLVVNI